MYELTSASMIRIGIFEPNANTATFEDLFNDSIMDTITIYKSIGIETKVIDVDNMSFSSYNFIFYVVNNSDINDAELLSNINANIKIINSQMGTSARSHLFYY